MISACWFFRENVAVTLFNFRRKVAEITLILQYIIYMQSKSTRIYLSTQFIYIYMWYLSLYPIIHLRISATEIISLVFVL